MDIYLFGCIVSIVAKTSADELENENDFGEITRILELGQAGGRRSSFEGYEEIIRRRLYCPSLG